MAIVVLIIYGAYRLIASRVESFEKFGFDVFLPLFVGIYLFVLGVWSLTEETDLFLPTSYFVVSGIGFLIAVVRFRKKNDESNLRTSTPISARSQTSRTDKNPVGFEDPIDVAFDTYTGRESAKDPAFRMLPISEKIQRYNAYLSSNNQDQQAEIEAEMSDEPSTESDISTATHPGETSIQDRLRTLNDLLDQGLINEDEASARRREILGEI